MRKFIGFLLVVVIALGIALGIRFVPGYILLQIRQFSVAAPLWLAALAIIIALFGLWLGYFIIKHVWYLPANIKHYVNKQQWRKTQRLLSEHLMQFLAQDWSHAQKGFVKLAQRRYLVRSMYLFAAICAKQQHQAKQQLDYIHRANEHPKCQHDMLFQLVLVDQLIQENKWQAAEDKLQPWLQHKHPQVLLRYIQVCCQLQYWSKAQQILPVLCKHKLLTETQQHQYQINIYQGLLQQAEQQGQSQFEQAWLALPKPFQIELDLLNVLLSCASQSQFDIAPFIQRHFEGALKTHWHDAIFGLYCEASILPLQARLTFADKWLKEVPVSAENQYAVGQIYWQSEMWEQAAMFFHKSLELGECVKTYCALANVYAKQSRESQALLMYQQAEKLAGFSKH